MMKTSSRRWISKDTRTKSNRYGKRPTKAVEISSAISDPFMIHNIYLKISGSIYELRGYQSNRLGFY